MLFSVKICGVTTPADARLVAEAGADAIGLNFVSGSPRRLGVEEARSVAAAIPRGVLKVGVFVGETAAHIRRIVSDVGLDAVQLHGHLSGRGPTIDPPELCSELAGLPVIRAIRLEPSEQACSSAPRSDQPCFDPLAAARAWLAEAATLGSSPAMVIVDASAPRGASAGDLGGTGLTVDWSALAACASIGVPMALAGGLTPDNVAAAIRASGAVAVDTASGVESRPGRKDPEKTRVFVTAAKAALPPSATSG